MQLAQAASQQQYDQQQQQHSEHEQHEQHAHVENPDVHHGSLPVTTDDSEKRGSKRRTSLPAAEGVRARRASKAARNDEHDVAAAAAAAAVAAAADGSQEFQLPESWSQGDIPAEIQKAYQQHLAQAQAHANLAPEEQSSSSSTSTAAPNFKPTRQLSTSKRAAQNRAAQRAFRERRDKYVKVLESKAARLEVAIRVANECKRRYTESLQTVDGLRQDNHTLRVALAALSGSSVEGQAPPAMKTDELLATLPAIPALTTEEEERVLAGVQGQGGAEGAGEKEAGGQSLDSLSAVAAAAAAAGGGGGGEGKESSAQQTEAEAEGEKAVGLPLPTSASGTPPPPPSAPAPTTTAPVP